MSNTLVACFSPTGHTLAVAQTIANATKGDLFVIEPVTPYKTPDLDWNDKQSRSTLEMNDKDSRPAIAQKVADMEQYKMIFLGFPIWWYDVPRIIATFLESYDFAGKTMIPFVTSGSSDLGHIPENLERLCPKARWLPGKRFPMDADAKTVEAWAKEHTDWQHN